MIMETETSIHNWPWYENNPRRAAIPDHKFLLFVLGKFEENDGLNQDLEYTSNSGGLCYQTEIVESVTVEELLGALEYAHTLMRRCDECGICAHETDAGELYTTGPNMCHNCHPDGYD